MLFNSFNFLFFLPIVFVLYWHVFQRNLRWQNLFVVAASYVFYGWWDWRFLLLIVFTSLCSYGSGLLIDRCYQRDEQKAARWWAGVNIVVNLLVLGIFKYFNFFADSFQTVMTGLGMTIDAPTLHVILPVGISFYTFQALSYTIDVYRRQLPVTRDIIAFFAFISFFPQLVAGPIERASNLLPQFLNCRTFDYAKAVDGLRQMLWGFFKKLVVADNCAMVVNMYWYDYEHFSGMILFLLGIMFAFQIYADFSGYSDIAIGCGKLFGVQLRRNFDYPYFSRNIIDFWRRWHISLMTWLRDYVYIPLGGSKCGECKTICNTFIVFLFSGLWHGPNWTFVVWGGYNGMLVVLTKVVLKYFPRSKKESSCWIFVIRVIFQMTFTFFLVVIGWILFRSDSLYQAFDYLTTMITYHTGRSNRIYGANLVIFGFIMLMIEWLQRDKQHAMQFPNAGLFRHRMVRWGIYFMVIMTLSLYEGPNQQFVYFQF